MALTIAQIEAKLAALRNVRDSGVLMTRHGDTSSQFRNLDEVNSIIADLETQLDRANSVTRTKRVRYIRQCSKGL